MSYNEELNPETTVEEVVANEIQDQNRWKSPVLWAAIVGQLVAILLMLGLFDEAFGQQVTQVASAVIQVLVLIGVLNNPTNKASF